MYVALPLFVDVVVVLCFVDVVVVDMCCVNVCSLTFVCRCGGGCVYVALPLFVDVVVVLTFVCRCGGGSGRALLSFVRRWARWGGRLHVTLAACGSPRAAAALSPGARGLGGRGARSLCCVDRTRTRRFPPQVVLTGDYWTGGRLTTSSRVRIWKEKNTN